MSNAMIRQAVDDLDSLLEKPVEFLKTHHAMHLLLVVAVSRLGGSIHITEADYEEATRMLGALHLQGHSGEYTATLISSTQEAHD